MLYDGEKQKEGATDMYLKTLDIHTAYTLEPAKLDLYLLDLSEKFADRERPLVLICPGGAYSERCPHSEQGGRLAHPLG